jgi:hypothetical protein
MIQATKPRVSGASALGCRSQRLTRSLMGSSGVHRYNGKVVNGVITGCKRVYFAGIEGRQIVQAVLSDVL